MRVRSAKVNRAPRGAEAICHVSGRGIGLVRIRISVGSLSPPEEFCRPHNLGRQSILEQINDEGEEIKKEHLGETYKIRTIEIVSD